VISPIELTTKYGTDALRMGLIIGNTPGTSTALYEDKIKAYKHFANKIWNASRFVIGSIEGVDLREEPALDQDDQLALAQLKELIKEVTEDIEKYRFYLAGEKLYHYFWYTFADIIIESSKAKLAGTPESKLSAQWTLYTILTTSLKLLHPFMPFVTEEIWGIIHGKDRLLMIERWPS
jgi:valyl-tRNA synthetase